MHALPALGRSAYERAGGSEIPGRSCSLQTGSLISSAHDSHRRYERLSANLLHYFVPGTIARLDPEPEPVGREHRLRRRRSIAPVGVDQRLTPVPLPLAPVV